MMQGLVDERSSDQGVRIEVGEYMEHQIVRQVEKERWEVRIVVIVVCVLRLPRRSLYIAALSALRFVQALLEFQLVHVAGCCREMEIKS